MKTNLTVRINKVFMYITLIWSAVMLVVYMSALSELPLFLLISYLPFGEFVCEVLAFFMMLGIWVVPVLYVITISLMAVTHVKFKEGNENKALFLSTAILPVALAVLMLLTNYIEVLA